MVKGNDTQVKCHYKGSNEDFIIFVESAQAVKEWKSDSSVPLAQVVNGWKVSLQWCPGAQVARLQPLRCGHTGWLYSPAT